MEQNKNKLQKQTRKDVNIFLLNTHTYNTPTPTQANENNGRGVRHKIILNIPPLTRIIPPKHPSNPVIWFRFTGIFQFEFSCVTPLLV